MTLQSHVLLLSIAYALLGALILLGLSVTRLARIVKTGAIIALSGFYIAVFYSLQGLPGWPAPVRVPERFQMLWGRVIEPDTIKNEPGAVYLWLEELDGANLPSGVPRAYALPYSAALAEKVVAAQAGIREGTPQGGGRTAIMGTGLGQAPQATAPPAVVDMSVPPGGDPSGGGLLDPEFFGGQSKTVDLAPLPAPVLPPKDNP